MIRAFLAAALALVAVATPAAAEQPKVTTRLVAARVAMPPVTRLASWRDRSFFPPASKQVVAVISKGAGGRGFHAWGVDVSKRDIAFNIALGSTEELGQFVQQLTGQLVRATIAHPNDGISWEILGEILPPPPPPDGPIGDGWWAQRLLKLGETTTKAAKAAFAGRAPSTTEVR